MGRESGIFLPMALFIFIILFIKPFKIFNSFIFILPYILIILFSFLLRVTGGFFIRIILVETSIYKIYPQVSLIYLIFF